MWRPHQFARCTSLTPLTVWIFLISVESAWVSLTPIVRCPWKRPSFESMEMFRSVAFFSLDIMDVMLVTMPMSSRPTTAG